MEDNNDILIKDDIVKDMIFNGGISGTTTVIVDAENLFGKISLTKKKSKNIIGERETHELCWRKDSAELTKSSNVSVPEFFSLNKIQKYANNIQFVNVVFRIKPFTSELWTKEG